MIYIREKHDYHQVEPDNTCFFSIRRIKIYLGPKLSYSKTAFY